MGDVFHRLLHPSGSRHAFRSFYRMQMQRGRGFEEGASVARPYFPSILCKRKDACATSRVLHVHFYESLFKREVFTLADLYINRRRGLLGMYMLTYIHKGICVQMRLYVLDIAATFLNNGRNCSIRCEILCNTLGNLEVSTNVPISEI